MAQMTEAQRIFHFVERAKKITKKAYLSDGRYTATFRINPQNFTAHSERNHIEVQTLGGFGRYDFGTRPSIHTLDGFTGIDGYDGPGGLYALEYFRPMIGKKDLRIMFGFPARFSGVRYCYLNTFEDRITPDKHLYAQYTIELVEFGPHTLQPAVQVPTATLPITPP